MSASLFEQIAQYAQQRHIVFSVSYALVETYESDIYKTLAHSGEVTATVNGITYSEFCKGDARRAAQRVYERIAADLGIEVTP